MLKKPSMSIFWFITSVFFLWLHLSTLCCVSLKELTVNTKVQNSDKRHKRKVLLCVFATSILDLLLVLRGKGHTFTSQQYIFWGKDLSIFKYRVIHSTSLCQVTQISSVFSSYILGMQTLRWLGKKFQCTTEMYIKENKIVNDAWKRCWCFCTDMFHPIIIITIQSDLQ